VGKVVELPKPPEDDDPSVYFVIGDQRIRLTMEDVSHERRAEVLRMPPKREEKQNTE
jgi:hypothetical protein